jgi:hypothetical protein
MHAQRAHEQHARKSGPVYHTTIVCLPTQVSHCSRRLHSYSGYDREAVPFNSPEQGVPFNSPEQGSQRANMTTDLPPDVSTAYVSHARGSLPTRTVEDFQTAKQDVELGPNTSKETCPQSAGTLSGPNAFCTTRKNGEPVITYVVIVDDKCPCKLGSRGSQMEVEMDRAAMVCDLQKQVKASLQQGALPFHMLSLVTLGGWELHSQKRLVEYFDAVRQPMVVNQASIPPSWCFLVHVLSSSWSILLPRALVAYTCLPSYSRENGMVTISSSLFMVRNHNGYG